MAKENKTIVGLTEKVKLLSANGRRKTLMAKVDTGASRSSLDTSLASELNLGPIIKSKMVKSAHGSRLRPIIEAEIEVAGKKVRAEFTLADRSHMKYRMLIGVNVLMNNFLIDPLRQGRK